MQCASLGVIRYLSGEFHAGVETLSLQVPFPQDLGSLIPSCLGKPELQLGLPIRVRLCQPLVHCWTLLDLFALHCELVNALWIKALEEVQLTSENFFPLTKVLTTLVDL